MKQSMKCIYNIALSCILISFISCTNQVQENKSSELKVAYLPITECSQMYVAQEKGFFDKQNLKIVFVVAKGGQNSIDKVVQEQADIGFASLATLIFNGLDTTSKNDPLFSVFGATFETMENKNHAIFMRKEKYNKTVGVKSIEKLKIAINEGRRMEHTMLYDYLALNHVDTQQVQILYFPFSKMYDVLKNQTVDVACMVEPQITLAKADSNLIYIDDQYMAVSGGKEVAVASYVSKRSICARKNDLVERFSRAMVEATEYMKMHDNEIKPIIAKYTQIAPEIMKDMAFPDYRESFTAENLSQIIQRMKNKGFIKTDQLDINQILIRCNSR